MWVGEMAMAAFRPGSGRFRRGYDRPGMDDDDATDETKLFNEESLRCVSPTIQLCARRPLATHSNIALQHTICSVQRTFRLTTFTFLSNRISLHHTHTHTQHARGDDMHSRVVHRFFYSFSGASGVSRQRIVFPENKERDVQW